MTKRWWAKVAGWLGAAALAVGNTNIGGKWGPLIQIGSTAIGGVLVGGGIHMASNTSAGHPNGDK